MQFRTSQGSLSKALHVVGKAVSNNNTLPILNNILVDVQKETQTVVFTSTNIEIGISCSIPAEVIEGGTITIPAKLLVSYISYLKSEEITFTSTPQVELVITSSSSKTILKGLPATEFPTIPLIQNFISLEIPIKDFLQALEYTSFCASSTKPILNGVLFKGNGKTLTLAATDSFRLSEKKILLEVENSPFQVIIPSKTVFELVRVFQSEEQNTPILIKISDSQLVFSQGNVEVSSRFISGNFPEYEQIIPTQSEGEIVLSYEEALMILKRISFFAHENNNTVLLKTNDTTLTFSTESTEYGSEEDTLHVEKTGGDIYIALNINYLLDIFQTLKTKELKLVFGKENMPLKIIIPDHTTFVHIIMPLKI